MGSFPIPMARTGSETWKKSTVMRWGGGQGPEVAVRPPIRFWPGATEPADYLGVDVVVGCAVSSAVESLSVGLAGRGRDRGRHQGGGRTTPRSALGRGCPRPWSVTGR